MKETRVRFAPSPTGIPHIGNTRTTLMDYLFAKANGGKFILRIEDTDRNRLVEGASEKIIEILEILGLRPDEGPGFGGEFGPYVQSERKDLYKKYAEELVENGAAYRCFCSEERLAELREEQMKKKERLGYDKKCRHLGEEEIKKNLAEGKPFTIRMKMGDEQEYEWKDGVQGEMKLSAANIDDKVLLKTDGFPTYHLAVVVDDHLMEITDVLRGVEYISTTPLHLRLYEKLNWKSPMFYHLPLVLGPDKSKLSKRHGAKSVIEYREEGYLPEALVNFMVYLGWSYEDNSKVLSLEELVSVFKQGKLQKQNAIFDIEKLNYFNASWIRRLSDAELEERLRNFVDEKWDEEKIRKMIPLVKERMVRLSDFSDFASYVFELVDVDVNLLKKQSKRDEGEIRDYLMKVRKVLESCEWESNVMHEKLAKNAESCGWGMREAMMTIRVAISNKEATPPLFETLEVVGRDDTLKLIDKAIEKLK